MPLFIACWLLLAISPWALAWPAADDSLPYAATGLPAVDEPLQQELWQRLPAAQRQLLLQAQQALAQGDSDQARQLLQPLLQPPAVAAALLLLAESALQQRDWPRASLLYAAAVAASDDELLLLSGRERLAQLQANWGDDPQWQPQPVSRGLRLPLRFLLGNQVVPRPHRYLNVRSNGQLRWQLSGQQRFATLLSADQLIIYDSVEQRLLTRPSPGSNSELLLTRHFAYAWRHDSNLLWRWQLPAWQPLAPTALSRTAGEGWALLNGASSLQPDSEQAWVVVRDADELQLINASGGEPLRLPAPGQGQSASLSPSADGRQLLLYLPQQPRLQWWDLAAGQLLAELPLPPQTAGLAAHFAGQNWADGRAELHFAGEQPALALSFGRGQPLAYQPLVNPSRPEAPNQAPRQFDFALPPLQADSQLQLQSLGANQLLAVQRGYPPFVVELPAGVVERPTDVVEKPTGRISRALVAESDQPLVMALGLADGTVLTTHDSGTGDGELFIWQPPRLSAAVVALVDQLAPRSGESSSAYTSRLAGISAGYCGRVYPLHYDSGSGVYSLDWQGAEVTLVVPAHARPGRQQRLELCGTLHPLAADQLELRAISLQAR